MNFWSIFSEDANFRYDLITSKCQFWDHALIACETKYKMDNSFLEISNISLDLI